MTCPTAPRLLRTTTAAGMAEALARYPTHRDDVIVEVHGRMRDQGHATKLDLAALIAWKHVQNAKWMVGMLELPGALVETKTAAALAPALTDSARIDALDGIPGFGAGGPFTSVLLCAWDPQQFGVQDKIILWQKWPQAVVPSCVCNRRHLPTYFDHLRQIADELHQDWTPRRVDMALCNL